ncbi:choice-of-anchor M domain-containing protein [Micromonospora sp. 067-2]|uniref:choice-of-anchor M domain-containing protein n=1 Tax=Micromonospora sp. 067-2 TaxID=2789270 RepID=UPI00397CF2E3
MLVGRMFAVTVAATLATVGLLAAPASAATISSGHLDVLDVDYDAGALTLDIKTHSPISPVTDDLSPVGTVLRVSSSWTSTVPSGAAWSCLGAAGSTFYVAPQAYDANKLYAGWDSTDVPAAQGPVKMELVSAVSSPAGGRFALYTTATSGLTVVPTFRLNSNTAAGCATPVWSGGIGAGVHGHGNWAFSQVGTYTLTFRATAGNGAGPSSGNVTYTFQVG